MTSNRDLRAFQEDNAIQDAFSKLVSRKSGYKTIIEKKEPLICPNESCRRELEPSAKFCASCGTKLEKKSSHVICTKCYNLIGPDDKFCMNCGEKKPEV